MSINRKSEEFCVDNESHNNEEEEDEEEQLRRREEIQNLLNVAMGDFNYDESTLNSLNGSAEHLEQSQFLQEKYKEAEYDDTVKALYEARTLQLESVTKKLEELEHAKANVEKELERKIICLTAEQEQLKISLKESQNLNLCKTEEINKLLEKVQELQSSIKELEEKLVKISEERNALYVTNNNLRQQLVLWEKGFLPKQNAEQQERIKGLELEIEKLSVENEGIKSELQRKNKELENFKLMTERVNRETDEVFKDKDEQFNQVKTELHTKQLECVNLNGEVQRLTREKEDLKYTLKRIQTMDLQRVVKDLQEKLKEITSERDSLKEKNTKLLSENKELQECYLEEKKICAKLKLENEKLIEENKKLQSLCDKNENKSQISLVSVGVQITDPIHTEYKKSIEIIKKFDRENNALRLKCKEQESVIQKRTQELIKIKQEKRTKAATAPKGANAQSAVTLESMKLEYEAQILQVETQLRESIKKEYDEKLQQRQKTIEEKLQKQCIMTAEKRNEELLERLKNERIATIELTEELYKRCVGIEEEGKMYLERYLSAEKEIVNLRNKIKKLKEHCEEKSKNEIELCRKLHTLLIGKCHGIITKSLAQRNNEIAVLQENGLEIEEKNK